MKKFTLLFATMLAMSGIGFGQREGKVIWENALYSKSYPIDHLLQRGATIIPIISPSGNIMVQHPFSLDNFIPKDKGVKVYNRKGELLWTPTDFHGNPSAKFIVNGDDKNVTYLSSFFSTGQNFIDKDSVYCFDKEFKFIKGFDIHSANTALYSAVDGIFYNNSNNTLIKYNLKGIEEWRFESDNKDPIQIITQQPPYIGSIKTRSGQSQFISLSKNGKKYENTYNFPFYAGYFPTNDKGFWAYSLDNELVRFDSTAKQMSKSSAVNYGGAYPTVLSDNSILLPYVSSNELLIIKISPQGEMIKYSVPVKINTTYYAGNRSFLQVKEISPNKIMFAISMHQALIEKDIKCKIGVIDFKDTSLSWSKEINSGASDYMANNGSSISLQDEYTFLQVYSQSDNPSIKTFKIYDINGSIKWESPFYINNPPQTQQWRIDNNYLYINAIGDKSGIAKVNCTDGKMLWQKEGKFVKNFFIDIQKNRNGDELLQYSFDKYEQGIYKGNTTEIATLNTDGTVKWIYNLSKSIEINTNFFQSYFTPAEDGKLVVLSFEVRDNKDNYILRKISPCEDLNAIAITANKTEACPTESVKLSIPKQDGVSYQWQKDGKDIPNVRDGVHDFNESGTYTVVAKDEICQNTVTSNALKINIRSLPTAQITAPKTTFCDGEKTTIAATTNGTFFQWQKDNKDIPNATTGIYEVSQSGDYRVGIRDDKCPQVGFSNIYTINVKPSPESSISTDIKGVIYEPFTVKMTANTGTGLAYQWLKDDVAIPNEIKANYEVKKSGKYNVSVTKDGCTKLSDALTISILIPLSNSEEIGEDQVQVYPNPSKGEFKIILPKSLKSAEIQLFDTFGRERFLTYVGEQAQANGLTQGVYFVRVSKGEKVITSKLVIE